MSKPTKDETARESVWGGAHVRLAFKEGRANVLFDCAHGEIAEPLSLDSEGRFDLRGTLVRRQAGHVVLGEKPDSQPARYSGKVVGDEMSLTVTLADSRETFDTFTLTRGSPGRLWKCY